MKNSKKILVLLFVFVLISYILLFVLMSFVLTLYNRNEAHSKNAISWFEDTGILIKDDYSTVYHILKDKNGWLYYSEAGHTNAIAPVVDADGEYTKDTNIFSN